jgi:hypothetical protein
LISGRADGQATSHRFAEAEQTPADRVGRLLPYYAGYPELFARELLQSAKLSHGAVVLDPWNGSGIRPTPPRRWV